MVDNSDLLVAYIERKTGGAAKLFEYAQMVRVQTLNLAKVDK